MTRAIAFLIHNWPLKLAAVVLATLLYAGLTVSENVRSFPGRVPVTPRNIPANTVLLEGLPEVTNIRFFAPPEVGQLEAASFTASIDLAAEESRAGAPITNISVHVSYADPRVTVVSFDPQTIQVRLDPLVTRRVPVRIDRGEVPAGLEIGPAQLSVEEVTASGPESAVRLVAAAQARIVVQPSGIDVDGDYELRPVDAAGAVLRMVDLRPPLVNVQMNVGASLETKSLPVNPVVIGTPGSGFELATVTVEPLTVSVQGDVDVLRDLATIDTAPFSISGAVRDTNRLVDLALPEGITSLTPQVRVVARLRSVTGTRSLEAGITLSGANESRRYALSTDRTVVTLGGTTGALNGLSGRTVVMVADVSGLAPGIHEVPLRAPDLPTGISLVAATPARVRVTITLPPTPPPDPSAAPSPTPTPSEGQASVPTPSGEP